METLFYRLGYAVCHQMPERSISISGFALPVCARDTGLYLGLALALVYLFATHKRDNELPPLLVKAMCLFFIGFMALDGLTSYLGMRDTNNAIRLVSGLLAGISFAAVLVPLINSRIWLRSKAAPVLADPRFLLGWLIIPIVIIILIGSGFPGFLFWAFLTTASIIVVFTAVNLLILTALWCNFRPVRTVWQLTPVILISVALSAIELTVVAGLRTFLHI